MNWLQSLGGKVVAIILLGLLVVGLAWFGFSQWQHARTAATESRLQGAQTGAVVESAKDAIATQGAAAARETASEALTRTNAEEIRNAKGADAAVDPAARDAGLHAACRRNAYSHSERCRLFVPHTP